VRKTGRNGAATLEILTPIASICTYQKFRFWISSSVSVRGDVFIDGMSNDYNALRKIDHMIKIRRIELHEVPFAKELIYRVAHEVFGDTRPLEDSIAFYESKGTLDDMDDVQKTYFENDGIFLVMTDEDRIIGTGAVRRLHDTICELKRVWLLFAYHGRGLGYQMIQELFAFAREKGYLRIRLETEPDEQRRAYDLYKRLGFYEIPRYSQHQDEVAMEMEL
jgi:putative acetyltransferase